jgi:hypothetical protein
MAVLLAAAPSAPAFGPFGGRDHPVTRDARPAARPEPGRAPGSGFLRLPWLAYRAGAGFQGPRCPHRPSCSVYALQAVDAHGPLVGAWLTVNRLLRGAGGPGRRPLPRDADGRPLDPLERADFFLARGRW